jgi:hypothetical protein
MGHLEKRQRRMREGRHGPGPLASPLPGSGARRWAFTLARMSLVKLPEGSQSR